MQGPLGVLSAFRIRSECDGWEATEVSDVTDWQRAGGDGEPECHS